MCTTNNILVRTIIYKVIYKLEGEEYFQKKMWISRTVQIYVELPHIRLIKINIDMN